MLILYPYTFPPLNTLYFSFLPADLEIPIIGVGAGIPGIPYINTKGSHKGC